MHITTPMVTTPRRIRDGEERRIADAHQLWDVPAKCWSNADEFVSQFRYIEPFCQSTNSQSVLRKATEK